MILCSDTATGRMQATCSCRHRLTGSSNRKARSTLQSRWALVLTPTWMQMSPRATVPGYRRFRRPRNPASRNGTGHLLFASRVGCKRAEMALSRASGPGRLSASGVNFLAAWAARPGAGATPWGDPTSRASRWAGPGPGGLWGGKAREAHALVVRGAQPGTWIRGAERGREPAPRAIELVKSRSAPSRL